MRLILAAALLLVSAIPAVAGGAWVPDPGQGYVQLGFSRKQADTSWNASGDAFANSGRFQVHDFRYGYLSGEVGLLDRLSTTFLVTYLNGLEGPRGHLHENNGWSDAWFGLKYALREQGTPMALALTVRTAAFYDQDGPYTLELHDDDGNFIGLSPEWRGVLKEDYTLSFLASRSIAEHRGWWNLETGYTYRVGAPADQVPLYAELGYPLPLWNLRAKASTLWAFSLGNDSERRPNDRFGSRPGFNFNDASMGRVGVGVIIPVRGNWGVELGYNQWVWGRSARRYQEPYLSIGSTF